MDKRNVLAKAKQADDLMRELGEDGRFKGMRDVEFIGSVILIGALIIADAVKKGRTKA